MTRDTRFDKENPKKMSRKRNLGKKLFIIPRRSPGTDAKQTWKVLRYRISKFSRLANDSHPACGETEDGQMNSNLFGRISVLSTS